MGESENTNFPTLRRVEADLDPINILLARCYAAIRIDGGSGAEFTISHPQGPDEGWYVGYRNKADWKDTHADLTLVETLTGWLEIYEDSYWPGQWEGNPSPHG